MKIKFLGVGSAFTTADYYQSNLLITAQSGKKLLLDCGSDIRFSLNEAGINAANFGREIEAVYISHLHSDHIGGLEWVAINTYFVPNSPPPKLFMNTATMEELWNHSLQGGLKCIKGKVMHLDDYFECFPISAENRFTWEAIDFTLWRMPHVMADSRNHYSYGLLMSETGGSPNVFISTDTQFQPEFLTHIHTEVGLIFHDVETTAFRTTVHAHYDELCTLPPEIKKKMWLYHYQPKPDRDPVKDGFNGFVVKGQEFDLC